MCIQTHIVAHRCIYTGICIYIYELTDGVHKKVIVLNCAWIAVDTDYNDADSIRDAPLAFQIADNLFCAETSQVQDVFYEVHPCGKGP